MAAVVSDTQVSGDLCFMLFWAYDNCMNRLSDSFSATTQYFLHKQKATPMKKITLPEDFLWQEEKYNPW